MEKDSSEEMLGICLNQEVTELIQKVFAKNGTIDAKELRNAEWRLKAIGVPTIPILLDYISLANSKDVTERIKGNMAIGMLVENR